MKTKLKIEGMTCQNCVKHVRQALESVAGVTSAEVDLDSGLANVDGEAAVDQLIAAVQDEGYEARTA